MCKKANCFSESFSIDVNLTLFKIGLKQKLFSFCKNIWIFEMVSNQGVPNLKRVLSSIFLMAEKFKLWESIEECVMCIENHVLVKKNLQIGYIGLPLKAWVKRSMERKHWLTGKEKLLGATATKYVISAVFCDMKRVVTIDLHEKGAIVNSASYCQFQRQNSPYSLNETPLIYIYIYIYIYTHTHINALIYIYIYQ